MARSLARRFAAGLAAAAATACGPVSAGSGPGCEPSLSPLALGQELREVSGVAPSATHADVFWAHNDAGSVLFAVNAAGEILARHQIRPRLHDWEDLALGQCPDGGSCLYLADTGDNYEEREGVALLRVREPQPRGGDTLQAETFPLRLPDGPRDIEALLVLPGERVLLVTKGRNHPLTVYRYPGALRPDTVTLQEVQRLSDGARILPRQITGGAASPRGGVVALRTYESVQFYRVVADTLVALEGALVNLRPLREPQGEGIGIGLDGTVALASEGGPAGAPGSFTLMRCQLDGG